MTPREMLDRILAEHAAIWSEADRSLVAAIARDATNLAASAAAGEDVEREWPHLRAQLASVSAAAATGAQTVLAATLRRLLGGALDLAFARLGLPPSPAGG